MKSRFLLTGLAVLGVLGWVPEADAFVVTYNFSGTVTIVDPFLAAYFSVGDPVSGSVSFESTTPDTQVDPSIGYYSSAVSSFSVTVVHGTPYTASAAFGHIVVENDLLPLPVVDTYFVTDAGTGTGPMLGTDFFFAGMQLSMEDTDATVYSSDALPPGAPPFGQFELDQSGLFFVDRQEVPHFVGFDAVPEPGSMALFALGALVVLLGVRRKRGSA